MVALLDVVEATVRVGEAILALDALTCRINEGERVAVIGPSGAGKSTLLALANGSVGASAGSVLFRGEVVRDDDLWRKRHGRTIATIHQQLNLVGSMKVIHNVNAGRLGEWRTPTALLSLVRPRDRDVVEEALTAVGLGGRSQTRTDRLSGGEQQRVAIARALVQRPSLLLADEPVSSLDPARADDIVGLLTQVSAHTGCALLMSLHTPALVRRHCDRVIALRHGRLEFDRAIGEVSESDFADLYRLPAA